MNWKTVVGIIIIFAALKEMLLIIIDYRSGRLEFWPFGVEIGLIAIVACGVYLIRKGQKQKDDLRSTK